MYDYLITKDAIIKAVNIAQEYDCKAFSPDFRAGIKAAFSAMSDAVGEGCELGCLFHLAAVSIRVRRNGSPYAQPKYWALQEMRNLGGSHSIKEVFQNEQERH